MLLQEGPVDRSVFYAVCESYCIIIRYWRPSVCQGEYCSDKQYYPLREQAR